MGMKAEELPSMNFGFVYRDHEVLLIISRRRDILIVDDAVIVGTCANAARPGIVLRHIHIGYCLVRWNAVQLICSYFL